MKRGLSVLLILGFLGIAGFLVHPAPLCLGAEQSKLIDSPSPLFLASLDKTLTDLSSARIALDAEVNDPEPPQDETGIITLAQVPSPGGEVTDSGPRAFPTTAQTCAGSGGATCRGTVTCAGSETCFGNITCGTTCAGSGGATCAGTVTCGEYTCSGRVCREMSPFR
jgi:hypothetical protein